jgi:hypothetical protein
MPRRPSGADKKQNPAKKEGRQGRSRNRVGTDGRRRSPGNSDFFAANQHCQTLAHDPPKCGRFGEKIMRHFMLGAQPDAKPVPTFAGRALEPESSAKTIEGLLSETLRYSF